MAIQVLVPLPEKPPSHRLGGFSTKSTLSGGRNIAVQCEIPLTRSEIAAAVGGFNFICEADFISIADFILA